MVLRSNFFIAWLIDFLTDCGEVPPIFFLFFILIIGDKTLYITGGEDPNSNNDSLLISYYNLPRKLDWSIERLLWLACYKNNVENDECLLSQCPPMIVYKIISYINSDILL